MTEDQIKHMVDRFLNWKLPKDFNPDGGISFAAYAFEDMPDREYRREPVGTNLFTATQAKAMVLHMIEGLPISPVIPSAGGEVVERVARALASAHGREPDGVIDATLENNTITFKASAEWEHWVPMAKFVIAALQEQKP